MKSRHFQRIAISVATLVLILVSASARAYTSNGSDGQFRPTASVVFASLQTIFNFTDVFIPSGVTVSFQGIASAQPIELLAMGNITIAGTLDVGANDLWIETPGSITLSGLLHTSGRSLTFTASSIDLSGRIEGLGDITLATGGGGRITPIGGDLLPGGGGTLCVSGRWSNLLPVPEPEGYALFLAGLGLLGAIVSRRKHSHRQQTRSYP